MRASFISRKLHKWLFLLIGLQMVLWAVSGFYMVSISIDYIHGDHLIQPEPSSRPDGTAYVVDIKEVLSTYPTATHIETGSLLEQPVYEVSTPEGAHLIDAQSGAVLSPLPRQTIEKIAQNLYAGPGPIRSVRLLTDNPPSEIQSRPLPLWQVNFDDPASPTLYLSPITGELVTKRHDFWRAFDFLWMFHIMDYENRSDVNNWLLRFSATVVSFATLSGLWLLFYSFNHRKTRTPSQLTETEEASTPVAGSSNLFRSLHKWLGLIIGLQVSIWAISGLVMGILPHDTVQGHDRAEHHTATPLLSDITPAEIREISTIASPTHVETFALRRLDQRLVYEIRNQNGIHLYDARTGERITIGETLGRTLADRDYAGTAPIVAAEFVQMPTHETRRHTGPAWKVTYDDSRDTTLYISAETGDVIARRNDVWRVFDVFWMLHMMDYTRQDNFNSFWIITVAFFGLWLSITGVILLFQSFSKAEFRAALARLTPGTSRRSLTIYDSDGGHKTNITPPFGLSVYDGLAYAGISLPSSCGGGGSCGLCRVKFTETPPPALTPDRHHFSRRELDEGYRLSCQHRLMEDLSVIVPKDAFESKSYTAEVASNRPLSPTIREIRLKLKTADDFSYRAGSYMLVDIPTPDGPPLQRAYSMATSCMDHPGEIVFNVRYMPAPENVPGIPAGLGSSYMCALKAGDIVRLSGPFGDFAARNSDHEMVFIGGGAGMAPLRAIIRDQLLYQKTSRKISFWYGARNAADILYQEEFENLAAQHDNMEFHVGLSAPLETDNWQGATGNIHEIVLKNYLSSHPDLGNIEFYLCGPPAMLAATRKMLRDLGIKEEKIAFDDFGI